MDFFQMLHEAISSLNKYLISGNLKKTMISNGGTVNTNFIQPAIGFKFVWL